MSGTHHTRPSRQDILRELAQTKRDRDELKARAERLAAEEKQAEAHRALQQRIIDFVARALTYEYVGPGAEPDLDRVLQRLAFLNGMTDELEELTLDVILGPRNDAPEPPKCFVLWDDPDAAVRTTHVHTIPGARGDCKTCRKRDECTAKEDTT